MINVRSIPHLYRNVKRWTEILTVLSKYGLADWLAPTNIDFIKDRLSSRAGESIARLTREARIRLTLTELGPTFIKLGQLLSTRPDVVGRDLADELKQLQAATPADPPEIVQQDGRDGAGPIARRAVRRIRSGADRVGLDRPGSSRAAEDGRAGRRQSAARRDRQQGQRGSGSARRPGSARRAVSRVQPVSADGQRGRDGPHASPRARFRPRRAQSPSVRRAVPRRSDRLDSQGLYRAFHAAAS